MPFLYYHYHNIEGFHAKWAYIAFWADFHFFAELSLFLAEGLVLT